MLKVIHSNRLERLFARLALVIEKPISDPLKPEHVVVQSPGMSRWLTLQLASHLGICANVRFSLPAGFVWNLMREHFGDLPEQSRYDRAVLIWRVMDQLPQCTRDAGFGAIKTYLQNDPRGLKCFQLSKRIADLFDQYLVYRPDWIAEWESGRYDHWQARLWRRLVQQTDESHRAGLLHRYLKDASNGEIDKDSLPERIFVFGLAALPPVYLDALASIGEHTDVYLFVLNPCLSYWGDIVDEKTLTRLQGLWQRKGWRDVSELYPVGNALLASMGKLGRDTLELVHAKQCVDEDAYALELPQTLLGRLQQDILLLQQPDGGAGVTQHLIAEDDRSVEVHSCYGPMREVEVLYDQLLHLLDNHPHYPGLTPSDIVVMMPDIDRYAPYVEAVFGTANGNRYIPWSIADRTLQSEHAVIRAFFELLQLPNSRFEASTITSLLDVPAIRRQVGLDESELVQVLTWIRESGIRWGFDQDARQDIGIPNSNTNTWAFGLDRLLLGYAMPADSPPYRGILPYTDIEGKSGENLGKLATFINRLASLQQNLKGQHSLRAWRIHIAEALSLFDDKTDSSDALAIDMIYDSLDTLTEETRNSDFNQPLAIEVVREYLESALRVRSPGYRFLSGGVTFCRMMPLRSIPFRVVCLIGMNDADYPRPDRTPVFDLIAHDPSPRRGDRSRREDDRYLFLEALLSSREKFYISYTGNSMRDSGEHLPSVLVGEFLDYAEKCSHHPDFAIREWLTVRHPMQPFSPRYANPICPYIFTYSDSWMNGAQALQAERKLIHPFFSENELSEPGPEYKELDLDTLIRFLKNPTRFILRERLGVRLAYDSSDIEDEETFALDGYSAYRIRQQCLELALQGYAEDALFDNLSAQGILPHGEFGRIESERQCAEIEQLSEAIRKALAKGPTALPIDLAINGFHLTGHLSNLAPTGMTTYRNNKRNAIDLIDIWIRHLALNAAAKATHPTHSQHFSSDGVIRLMPAADAMHHLADLLDCYWEGLRHPIPFFPKSSFAYAKRFASGETSTERLLHAARREWETSGYTRGEDQDPYFSLIARDREPLDQDFQRTAIRLCVPLIQHIEGQTVGSF